MTLQESFREIARIFITLGVFDLGCCWLANSQTCVCLKANELAPTKAPLCKGSSAAGSEGLFCDKALLLQLKILKDAKNEQKQLKNVKMYTLGLTYNQISVMI